MSSVAFNRAAGLKPGAPNQRIIVQSFYREIVKLEYLVGNQKRALRYTERVSKTASEGKRGRLRGRGRERGGRERGREGERGIGEGGVGNEMGG